MSTAAVTCSRCGDPASHKQGHQSLCSKHYRFGQMRAKAKAAGKLVPTHEQLEELAKRGASCPDCSCEMNWLARNGASTVASLQHYRDGSLAIVCLSCNSRHASMPGDTFRDMQKDHKRCPACKEVKPLEAFAADHSRSGPMQVKSTCKLCSAVAVNNWKEKNREIYNQYQREYRAKRKASGNPVRSGT